MVALILRLARGLARAAAQDSNMGNCCMLPIYQMSSRVKHYEFTYFALESLRLVQDVKDALARSPPAATVTRLNVNAETARDGIWPKADERTWSYSIFPLCKYTIYMYIYIYMYIIYTHNTD